MNTFKRKHWAGWLALVAIACLWTTVAAAQTAVPVPKYNKLPITFYAPEMNNSPLDAFPLLAASRNLRPYDLKKAGYVEDEYIISGASNVYDLNDDGTLKVVTPNAPYTTRLLVRHPADPAKFSGTVLLEIPNTARRFDWVMMWGYLSDGLMARGDAFAVMTTPAAVSGLKQFNPERYAAVNFNNPNPGACPATPQNPSEMEDGLKWDAFSQVSALLKSNDPNAPLGGKATYAYMSTQGGDPFTYAKLMNPRTRINGKMAFDGFLFKQPGGLARMNRCATPIARNDPRNEIKNLGVPSIGVVAQGEVPGTVGMRRPDSDDPNDRYRLWEVAGGVHLERASYYSFPSMNDAATAGNAQGTPEFPFNARCEPEIQLVDYPLMPFIFRSAFDHLDKWARGGAAPPHAPRIEVKENPNGPATVMQDKYGVALGGIRTFWSDAPTVQFYQVSTGPGNCPEIGHAVPLPWAQLEEMYGNAKSYSGKALASIDKTVKDGWFTENDGARIKAEVTAMYSPGGRTGGAQQ